MRSVTSFAAACAVTLALFYLMQFLVTRNLPDHAQPVRTVGVRLVTLQRPPNDATAPAGGQSQPPAPAPAPPSPMSAPAQADLGEEPAAPAPVPKEKVEAPTPETASIEAPPVRKDPPVVLAKKAAPPQKKPESSKPKTLKPAPIKQTTRKSSRNKKAEEKPQAKPQKKVQDKPREKFQPWPTAGRESSSGKTSASTSNPNSASAPSDNPVRNSASEVGKKPVPSNRDGGAAGNSPVAILSKPKPVYPRSALQRGQEGWVKISFIVNEQGRIENPSVVSSRPRRVFDRAALQAIEQWRFRPRKVNGQPVRTQAIQEIKFTLPR